MRIAKEEQRFIKINKALPKSIIEQRLIELRNDLENASPENFKHIQEFIRELKYWLGIIGMIEKRKEKSKKTKPDTSI